MRRPRRLPCPARRPARRHVRDVVVRASAAASLAALCAVALPTAPASAHGEGLGDVATNSRGEQVAPSGEARAMRHVANLQYDRTGEVQNGSDIEFLRLGDRRFALAGTLGGGLQVIDITDPRSPRRVAVYDCDISQGDVQVWRTDKRVLASYTADGTVGAAGAASTCGRDLDLSADDSGTVIVDLTTPRSPTSVSFRRFPAARTT